MRGTSHLTGLGFEAETNRAVVLLDQSILRHSPFECVGQIITRRHLSDHRLIGT